jgi:hypothetical protein
MPASPISSDWKAINRARVPLPMVRAGPAVRFVRVGTMDSPDLCPPDIHIFTSSKQPWVTLSPGAKAVPEFYDLDAVWPAESLERRRIMRAKARQK